MTEATDQRKPSIYVSNRMRGLVRYNFPWFDATRDHLASLGWNVISPADIDRANGFDAMTREFPDDFDWNEMPLGFDDYETILLRDIDAIQTCDAIFMGRDWEQSCGANRELTEARKLGLREFYEDVCASPSSSVMCAMADGMVPLHEFKPYTHKECQKRIDAMLRGAVPNREIVDVQTGETRTVDSSGERVFEDDGIGKCVRHLYDIAQQFDTPCGIPEPMGETRITDALTGGQKGAKAERYDLLPVEPLSELARHYGIGAKKYADHNYRKGYKWSLSYAALQRHLNAFWRGEDIDAETGSKHVIAAAFHCLALAEYMDTRRSHDDRYKRDMPETQA